MAEYKLEMRNVGSAAQLQTLIDYFRNDGAQFGQRGDDLNLSPVGCAIHHMRELAKINEEIARTRVASIMRAPVAHTCPRNHHFYREAHTLPDCPFCLRMDVTRLQGKLDETKEQFVILWNALK